MGPRGQAGGQVTGDLSGGDGRLGQDPVAVGTAVDDQALTGGHATQGRAQLGVQEVLRRVDGGQRRPSVALFGEE